MAVEVQPETEILLAYKREENLSTGYIMASRRGIDISYEEKFDKAEYRSVLKLLARTIRKYVPNGVVLVRTDRPGLLPYEMDQETIDLFRVDPVAAIHSMLYEIDDGPLMDKKENQTPLEAEPVRVGYDTLADAFGDQVYVRARAGSVECPGCGQWIRAVAIVSGGHRAVCSRTCFQAGLEIIIPITLSKFWASVDVEELFKSPLQKFFLPRPWNDGRLWVTREELATKYNAYKAEKEIACSVKEMV